MSKFSVDCYITRQSRKQIQKIKLEFCLFNTNQENLISKLSIGETNMPHLSDEITNESAGISNNFYDIISHM